MPNGEAGQRESRESRESSRESRGSKRRDDRFESLKRRVIHLARLEGDLLLLSESDSAAAPRTPAQAQAPQIQLHFVRVREVRSTAPVIARLQAHGMLDRATLERCVKLDGPTIPVDTQMIAAAHRDVRALDQRPALDLAREHRRALARYGHIDSEWLEAKRKRIEHIHALHTRQLGSGSVLGRSKSAWFDGVVELVRAMRGEDEASALAEAGARVQARGGERRKEARERVASLALALETGVLPSNPELAELATRLETSRELPGRARRRRVLEVLRRAVAWPAALHTPTELVDALAAPDAEAAYVTLISEAGRAMASALPIVRDPSLQERTLEVLAHLGLMFSIGEDSIPTLAEDDAVKTLRDIGDILDLAPTGLSLARAIALAKIPMKRATRLRVARWVAEGLEIELVADAAEKKQIENVVRVNDLRSARAYATWATRLSAHYQARGISFSLSPELFTHLPKNEDLAVLAMCLMEQVDPKKPSGAAAGATASANKAAAPDPIAVLDATLALFQKLPAKAKNILQMLRDTSVGEGRKLYPELAAWLEDDALLDRLIHIARLAGETGSRHLSSRIREDFEHAERTRGERAHLEKLAVRSTPQQGRLDALLRAERTLAGSPKGRTRRRIAERIEQLLPIAYRRELDATFREILLEVWDIDVPALTPAWRDAVRFLLVVDDNRKLLTQLLRKAAKNPGRDVKLLDVPRNEAWIASVKARGLNVDAWLAPRRREIVFRAASTSTSEQDPPQRQEQRFLLQLEEDPLEVLRMGIPFGTCLALDNGCNAAATVLNAIEANKRVLYVRNMASGNIVARKLLAISKDLRLIGYNLYVSVTGEQELAIRSAVLEECRVLGREVNAPLSPAGEPEQLHADGFWYDDGTVPFDEDIDVAAYCKTLALPPPPKWFEDLGKEARAWRACETGDAETAVSILSAWDSGPANRALGAWIVDRLGPRAATQRAGEDSSVFIALARSLADTGEDGMVRALDLALRVPEYVTHHRIRPILTRFPPSPKIAVGLAEMGLRAIKRHRRMTDHGLAHLTMFQLPLMFDDVAGTFDLLDTIEPAWLHVAKTIKECADCSESAIKQSANIAEAIFARAPDPDVVVACLMSRHRSVTAQRAALRIAARHVLPNGDRALLRFASLHPKLASSPEGIAALVRQAQIDRVTESFVRKAPKISSSNSANADSYFEALRDLVRCDGLELLIRNHRVTATSELDAWSPGPWELAWRRRHRDHALQSALFERASRMPRTATRAMELLALLGDLERVGALDHVVENVSRASDDDANEDTPKKATLHDAPHACRRTAASLAEQVRAYSTHRIDLDVTSLPHADALYVDLARRVLIDDVARAQMRRANEDERDAARSVVLECSLDNVVDWRRLLAACAHRGDAASVRRILDDRIRHRMIMPRTIVDVWQLPDARDALVRAAERLERSEWCARVWAAEREANARGLSVEGLLERVALALVASKQEDEAIEVETLDQLRSIIHAITSEAAPEGVAASYDQLPDTLSVAIFVRSLRRLPVDRAAAIREAIKKKLDEADAGKAARLAWALSTRSSQSSTQQPSSSRTG